MQTVNNKLLSVLIQAIEESGYSLIGPTDHRAAENGEPKWVCNARSAIADAMQPGEEPVAEILDIIPGPETDATTISAPATAPQPAPAPKTHLDRDETIKRIREGLKKRSGKQWSVKGGTGTAWGWITIDAPPKRRTWKQRMKEGATDTYASESYEWYDTGIADSGHMSPAEREELGKLLGMDKPAHEQGESIASSSDYYREYVDRAEGRQPSVIGEPYWD